MSVAPTYNRVDPSCLFMSLDSAFPNGNKSWLIEDGWSTFTSTHLAAKSTSGKNDVFGDWTDEQARRRTMDHRSDSMEPAMKLYNESGEMIN
jgi:hypothetical protein